MTRSTRTSPDAHRTVAVQEEAALERRHWVRVAYACNNRCRFCLDAYLRPEGPFLDTETVHARMEEGRRSGATRLILSGGEASIHPAFLDFVRYGREIGYARVQTISNGRMFAYEQFLQRAVRAGLGEITFSLHSHLPEVHDDLTGVPGAFAQAHRGLRAALAQPDLVVSVDIVINQQNVATLADTVAAFADEGVGEFDLLHLVPFGRAFEEADHLVPLAVTQEELAEPLLRTIELGAARGLVLWTNRLPAPALEGHEHLIQDPHKLEDEVRGRHAHLQRMVEHGEPLPCRDDRCAVCYLAHFCDVLHPLQAQVAEGRLPKLRVTLGSGETPPDLAAWREQLKQLWIRAPDAATALRLPPPGVPEIWELDTCADLRPPSGRRRRGLGQRTITRVVVKTVEDLQRARDAAMPEILLRLNAQTWPWVMEHRDALPTGLVLGLPPQETLSAAVAADLDLSPAGLPALAAAGTRVEGLPPCLGGADRGESSDDYVDLQDLDAQGRLDPDCYVRRYIAERYRTHSLRCQECTQRPRCPGLHVNLVRAHGFQVLRPR